MSLWASAGRTNGVGLDTICRSLGIRDSLDREPIARPTGRRRRRTSKMWRGGSSSRNDRNYRWKRGNVFSSTPLNARIERSTGLVYERHLECMHGDSLR